jgi:hypothetical protein
MWWRSGCLQLEVGSATRMSVPSAWLGDKQWSARAIIKHELTIVSIFLFYHLYLISWFCQTFLSRSRRNQSSPVFEQGLEVNMYTGSYTKYTYLQAVRGSLAASATRTPDNLSIWGFELLLPNTWAYAKNTSGCTGIDYVCSTIHRTLTSARAQHSTVLQLVCLHASAISYRHRSRIVS